MEQNGTEIGLRYVSPGGVSSGSQRRFLLTANHSVIEPLFALYLLGTIRDNNHLGKFMSVRKYDFNPLIDEVEKWGATDVGFNVYSGNHQQTYRAIRDMRKRFGKQCPTIHIGGPHATYFGNESAEHADWVYKGQSFDSFDSYGKGASTLWSFVSDSLLHTPHEIMLNNAFRKKEKEIGARVGTLSIGEQEAIKESLKPELEELRKMPEHKSAVKEQLEKRVLFRNYLSDTFPKPDRKSFYANNPEMRDNPIKNSICGEGCLFKCTYCYNVAWNSDAMYGTFKRRTLRKIEDVIQELAELKQFGTKLVYFQDDIFGLELDWMEEFMPEYKQKVGIPFHAQLRLELAEGKKGQRRLKLMKEAGCTGVTAAIESGNFKVREKVLDRAMKERHIFSGCKNIKDSGLTLRTEQILGVPTLETKPGGTVLDIDLETLRTNCLVKPEIMWTAILAPYGGTKLGELCVKLGLYPANKLATNDDISDSFFDSSTLDYAPVYNYQVRFLQRFASTFSHVDWGHVIAERFLTEEVPKHDQLFLEDCLVPAKAIAKFTKETLYNVNLYGTTHIADNGSLEPCKPGAMDDSGSTGPGSSMVSRKSPQELLADLDGTASNHSLEELLEKDLNSEQQTVLHAMRVFWERMPSGALIAQQFISDFSRYTPTQRSAFITIINQLGNIARKELTTRGPMNRETEIQKLISAEEERDKEKAFAPTSNQKVLA